MDGKQGTAYRASLNQAYEGRPVVRALLSRLNILVGISEKIVGALDVGLIFGLRSVYAAWVVGWVMSWVWGGMMAGLSIGVTKAMLRREDESDAAMISMGKQGVV